MRIELYPKSNPSSRSTVTAIDNLRFSVGSDVVNTRVTVNEFECDIKTNGTISVGVAAELKGESLWFCGIVVYSERESEHMIHIRVSSELMYLERKTMPARMYSGDSVSTVLTAIFSNTGCPLLTDSAAISGKTVTGFCPEQTARERLQHVLFATGLYVQSAFVQHPTVTKLEQGAYTTIPSDKTYWKPALSYQDYVTDIKATAYAFSSGTPTSEDETVTDGTNTWIVTRTEVVLSNPYAPSAVGSNAVEINDVMLVNNTNVDDITSLLGLYYFKRLKVEADVINNGEYKPGKRYSISMGGDNIASGYAEEMDFSFGLQSKSRMTLAACETIASKRLTIIYKNLDTPQKEIGRRIYNFPSGYVYSITNPYLSFSHGNYDYVCYPTSATVSGTMPNQNTTVTVNCRVALRHDRKQRILRIISVDEVNRVAETEDGKTIYVAEIE